MKEILKNTFILCLITCVAGAALGGVYTLTKSPRAAQEQRAKDEANKKVLSAADTFEIAEYDEAAVIAALEKGGITEKSVVISEISSGLDAEGNVCGYVVTVTSKEGYGGNIQFSVGFDNDKKVTGISILSISETAGLGMNANEPEFLDQYIGKDVSAYVVVKDGADDESEIDAISGATITSNAMTKGVNAAIIAISNIKTA